MAKSDIQGFKDAHARYLGAKDTEKAPQRPDYHWWNGPDWLDVFYCLAKHGFDRCTVQAWDGLGEKGEAQLWIVVRDTETGEILGAFNVSHPCPPFCDRDKR